jgi:hypothetical protein
MMANYDTLSTALAAMRTKGVTEDFNLAETCLICNSQQFGADDFEITEVHRFEGPTDPADEAVLYGIESKNGLKGVLVNSYGYQSEPVSDAIARKLRITSH